MIDPPLVALAREYIEIVDAFDESSFTPEETRALLQLLTEELHNDR